MHGGEERPDTGRSDRGFAAKILPGRLAVGFAMAVGVLLLAGCASRPPKGVGSQATYGSSYEEVWEAVVDTLRGMNLNVKSMEKGSGRIVTEAPELELRKYVLGRYESVYCSCVSPYGRDELRKLVGTYAIALTRSAGNRTSVSLDASFLASRHADGRFHSWVSCPSKGIFEPFFLEQVESRLGAGKSRTVEGDGVSRHLGWWVPARGY